MLGTGTEVGKTWVSARLLERLRAGGLTVAARKPAQSSAPDDVAPSDADVLAGATGEDPTRVCPPHRRYGVAMAPPMAAEALGRSPFTVADLADEVTWAPDVDLGLLETAGGVLSPAAADGTSLDLARAVAPDLGVLVADAGLGTVNAVRLARLALASEGWPLAVVLNRFDDDHRLHRANREALAADGADLLTTIDDLVDRWRRALAT